MSFPAESFWKLVVDAQLLTLEDCHKHHAAWMQQNPKGGDAQSLAEFLVATNVISKYQASILLAGRAGPFVYGDYRIYDRIESGRLSGIFRALHVPSMHRVCLQFLTAEQAASPEAVAYLNQRATITSQAGMGSPHLMRCYHMVDLGAFKFFVLEDLQGKRVERHLQQQGAMKPSEACRVVRQAAMGLARLHSMQQFHGDVRPSNIWVDTPQGGAKGTVKMVLFPLLRDPLAQPIDWRQQLAQADGKIPPEADFVAPELIAGGTPDARSDIYQLGCAFYQLLTNKVPFGGETLRAKLEGHLKEQPAPVHKLNPNVPTDLSKLIGYMLQKKPEMRFQQVSVVVEKLAPFISTAEAQAQPAPPSRSAAVYEAWLAETMNAAAAAAANAAAAQAYAQQAPQQPMYQNPMQPGQMQPNPMQPYGMQPNPMQGPMGPQYGAGANPYGQPNPYAQQPNPYEQQAAFGQQAPFGQQPAFGPQAPFGQQPQFGQQPGPFGQPASPFGQPAAAAPKTFMPPVVEPPSSGPMFPSTSPTSSSSGQSAVPPKKGAPIGLILTLVLVPLLGGGGWWMWQRMNRELPDEPVAAIVTDADKAKATKPAPTATAPKATASGTALASAVKAEVIPKRDLIASVGTEPMYESPTAGKRLDLAHMVPGVQMVIALRPADIMKSPDAPALLDEKVSGSLGPLFTTTLPTITGVPNEAVEQVVVGILDGPSTEAVRYAYVVRYATPPAEADLVKAWGDPAEEMIETTKTYSNATTAYYLPATEQGKVAVIVPKEELKVVLDYKGAPASFTLTEQEYLLQFGTDVNRHLTILYSPTFLENGGRSLVDGPIKNASGAWLWLLTGVGLPPMSAAEGANAEAGGGLADGGLGGAMNSEEALPPRGILISAHLGETFFYELRAYNTTASAANEVAAEPFAARLKEIQPRLKNFLDNAPSLPAYSRSFLTEFSNMVKFADKYVRAGAADKQVVIRGYLPAHAAHNIVLGAYRSMLDPFGGAPAPTAIAKTTTPAAAGGPTTAAEKIKKPMSLTFNRNNLEVTMQLIADEIGVPIEILGTDLQLEGITKNQSFGLDEKMQPADQLLRTIMLKANPDNKLVYVIKPKNPGEPDMIFITTRAAVEKRKDKLPAELVIAAPAKK